MKRVVIVPVSEIHRFPGMTLTARGGTIAALLGESFEERSRKSFATDEEFYDAVATGRADLHTFPSTEEASAFAAQKIEALNATARQVEEALHGASPLSPQAESAVPPGIIPISKFRA